jgi:ketosteroid isomerase-like protein
VRLSSSPTSRSHAYGGQGIAASDAGPFRAGQELTAYIAQFVMVRDRRIVEIETYDCYEPFPAS